MFQPSDYNFTENEKIFLQVSRQEWSLIAEFLTMNGH